MKQDQAKLERWLTQTASILTSYFNQNNHLETPVVEHSPPLELKDALDVSLGEASSEKECWDLLQQILQKSVRTTHPLFLNQLFGGLQPESLSADWITSSLNPTMATFEVAPVLTIMEKELSRKLSNIIGFKLGEGIMVTGGSNANLVGLLCARQFKVPDIRKSGYQGKTYTVYVSSEAHYSYEKAAHIAGLGLEQVRLVKVDEKGAMDPTHLRELIREDKARGLEPMMIGATSGTTVLGAFDPLAEIAQISREFNLWLHIDAAWGGGAMFSSKHRSLLDGIHLGDSVTFDAHKTLNTGLITSFFLCKHPGMLTQTNQGGGSEYIFHDFDNSDWDTGTYSLQCGRRADVLKLWLLWKSRGDEGMAKIFDHLMSLSEHAHAKIVSHPRLKLISHQYLNSCFQVSPLKDVTNINEFTLRVRSDLVRKGKALVNFVQRPDGTVFFRLVSSNNQTQKEDLDRLFSLIDESIQCIDKIM